MAAVRAHAEIAIASQALQPPSMTCTRFVIVRHADVASRAQLGPHHIVPPLSKRGSVSGHSGTRRAARRASGGRPKPVGTIEQLNRVQHRGTQPRPLDPPFELQEAAWIAGGDHIGVDSSDVL